MLIDKLKWLKISERLTDEIKQCRYEGKEVSKYYSEIDRILNMEEGTEKEKMSLELYQKLSDAPLCKVYSYEEPETYEDIISVLPKTADQTYPVNKDNIHENIKGAWLGRSIGCLLGIPVETWTREDIVNMLLESGQYPLKSYIKSDIDENIKQKYQISDIDGNRSYDRKIICWGNNVNSFPVDDDMNYTISALRLVEEFGTEFTSDDVLENWLMSFPALHACTAERVAYQNALCMRSAPSTATFCNPYREWIGAQIRGDFFGYISPGNPLKAAGMAYRDAAVSHTKNGIYGEMYISALISLAAISKDAQWICKQALSQIPEKSRLYEDINLVLNLYQKGEAYDKVIEVIHEKYSQKDWFDWCYVNPNTMIVVAGVLYFTNDFSQGIIQTVLAGFDTDCNGATVGSVLGMKNGFRSIDNQWTKGLELMLHSSIHGYYELTLDEAVKRTINLIKGDN